MGKGNHADRPNMNAGTPPPSKAMQQPQQPAAHPAPQRTVAPQPQQPGPRPAPAPHRGPAPRPAPAPAPVAAPPAPPAPPAAAPTAPMYGFDVPADQQQQNFAAKGFRPAPPSF